MLGTLRYYGIDVGKVQFGVMWCALTVGYSTSSGTEQNFDNACVP